MVAVDLNLVSIIVFYSLIAAFFYIRRKHIDVEYKILFLYRTKKFNAVMEKIANFCPRFWRIYGLAAIPIGFAGMIFILSYLAYALVKIFSMPAAAPSLSLVVPGVRIPGSPFIPFWYGILALFIVIVVHEGAHGIVALANKLKIKSAGVGLMAFLPLAFVEPDEKQLEKQKTSTQLAVFAAGAFTNFITAGVVLLIAMLVAPVVSQAIVPEGTYFETVYAGKPAALAGLQHGDIITYVDSQNTTYATDLESYMLSVKPGQTITLKTASESFVVNTIPNPKNESRAYMGIEFRQEIDVTPKLKVKYGSLPFGLYYFLKLLYWIFALNIGIGVINLLPLGPIDGGRMARVALNAKIRKHRAMKIFTIISYLSLFLLIANIVMPYITKALA